MAEQVVQERTEQQHPETGQTRQRQGSSPLQTPRGSTHIDSAVVAKIAGVAAQEIDGVQMGGSAQRTMGGLMERVGGGGGGQSRGVSVDVGEVETAIDLTLAIEYGKVIPQITEAVRRNVIERVENLVGLRVTEVNVNVDNVYFEGQQYSRELQDESAQEEPRVR